MHTPVRSPQPGAVQLRDETGARDGTEYADGARMLRVAVALLVLTRIAYAEDDLDEVCACDVEAAACDASCPCDLECEIDWAADECAVPGAGCIAEQSDAELEAAETVDEPAEPVDWAASPSDVACPEGATNVDGACVAGDVAPVTGGCDATGPAGLIVILAIVLLARRRKLAPALLVACTLDGTSWDDAVDAGPIGDTGYHDVLAAELGDHDGVQFLLASQALRDGAQEPAAQFSLSAVRTGVPLYRASDGCGDRLSTTSGDELLGWARGESGDGTAALVELQAPDGCFVYETDPEAIDAHVTAGYAIVQTLAHVWPPGLSDLPPVEEAEPDTLEAPAPCKLGKRPASVLLYASPGKVETLRFLAGCPGEVIVGEKKEKGPVGSMKSPAAHAAGGRTAFVIDRNGEKLRKLLLRANGVERTAAYFRNKLKAGYDYIVIDEITAHPQFADGMTANRRLRKVLQRVPKRSVIPYISIDLTQYADGFTKMKNRRLLLRAFNRRARAIALEVYLHTPQAIAGAAPSAFRRAADRLALAVKGLKYGAGINRRAITVIATSIHAGGSGFAQYKYLDQPKNDLRSITKQVNAIRHGGRRLRSQKGVGYYFVNKSDMAPRGGAPYSYDGLIRRLRLQALRFK